MLFNSRYFEICSKLIWSEPNSLQICSSIVIAQISLLLAISVILIHSLNSARVVEYVSIFGILLIKSLALSNIDFHFLAVLSDLNLS